METLSMVKVHLDPDCSIMEKCWALSSVRLCQKTIENLAIQYADGMNQDSAKYNLQVYTYFGKVNGWHVMHLNVLKNIKIALFVSMKIL